MSDREENLFKIFEDPSDLTAELLAELDQFELEGGYVPPHIQQALNDGKVPPVLANYVEIAGEKAGLDPEEAIAKAEDVIDLRNQINEL